MARLAAELNRRTPPAFLGERVAAGAGVSRRSRVRDLVTLIIEALLAFMIPLLGIGRVPARVAQWL